jgi:ATP-binding cassette, subfamily B, multidrug efflux pump
MFDKLKPLAPYLRRYWKHLAWGGVAVILYNAIKVLIPVVIGHAIDDMQHGITETKVLHHALRLLLIAALSAVFLYITRQVIIGASREIEFDLRNDIFANLERQAPSYYHTHRTGDIMARTTNDLNAVRMLLGPAIMYSANTIVFTAAALPFMYRISPRLTFFAFVPLPMASILVQYFGARIHRRFERIQAMFSDISAKAQENFSGARLIRAFAQEDAEIASFETANREYIHRSLYLVRLMAMLWPTLEFVLGLSLMITLLVGGHEVVQHQISVGQFTSFNVYMVQLIWPIIAVGWVVNLFQRGTASVVRIDELLKQQPSITDDPSLINVNAASSAEPGNATFIAEPSTPSPFSANAKPNIPSPLLSFRTLSEVEGKESASLPLQQQVQGDIEFRNLTFAYPDAPPVLHDINLRIPAGSSLAIVGPTGSGKSTLVNLIPRLHDAPPGTVLIDGQPIRNFTLATLRESIGFVPQETFLFSETIRQNIAFGRPDASPEQVEEAATIAHISTEILEFPKGFDTEVGERGLTLSGGQKQRTAIARAVIRNPKILILDDALASVDTYTEERILSGLKRVMEGRTTIFISHRISTARNADQIAVLVAGRIAELGTHDELIARNGYYTSLFEKQRLEEELAVAT